MVENMGDVRALDPFFRIIEQGLAEFVDGDNFFELLPRTPPPSRPLLRAVYPPFAVNIVGGARILLRRNGCGHKAAVHQPIRFGGRHQGPQSQRVARLPRPTAGLRHRRGTPFEPDTREVT